jgi:hypothetical protein
MSSRRPYAIIGGMRATGEPDVNPGQRSLPYRAFFQTPWDYRDAVSHVQAELRTWLQEKRYDVDFFDAGRPDVGAGVVCRYAATNDATGWQLREQQSPTVAWMSRLTVTQSSQRQGPHWVSVVVEPITAPGTAAPAASVPRLIRPLLDTMSAHDSSAELRSYPVLVTQAQVEDLLETVCDSSRRLPMVVAAPPHGTDFEAWRQRTGWLMAGLPGVASMYILDPNAAPVFNSGIGSLWIGPGAVRTYLPDVDPAIDTETVRHRVLSGRRIEAEPARARKLLAALPRRLAASAASPMETAAPSRIDFARATPSADNSELTRLRADVQTLNELLRDASDELQQRQIETSRQQDEIMDLAHELELAQRDLAHRTADLRAVQRRLVEAGRFDDAYAPAPDRPELPTTFDELHARWPELGDRVVYTGHVDPMIDLDAHPQNAAWAQSAWNALRALKAYTEVKATDGFAGDFKKWCGDNAGTDIAPGKVARDESETVRNNKKLARMRTFPVPEAVDSTCESLMAEHIRLGATAQISPRMHYFDATGTDGRVYVGYIGPHLPNTQTS